MWLRKGVAAHRKMIDDLLNFELKDGDRVVWFDVLPNRLELAGDFRYFLMVFMSICFQL